MIPAYIMVLAMFTTRDPLTHSIAWGTSLICVVMIVSNVLTPGGALARTQRRRQQSCWEPTPRSS